MEVVTTSMMVLLLIFGLGLSGASYNTCKDTLNSNGYSLTDSQYQSFYEAANNPTNINYISNNRTYFADTWEAAAEQEEGDIYDWYRSQITMISNNNQSSDEEKPSWLPPWVRIPTAVDEAVAEGAWGDYGGVSSTVTVPQRDLEDIFFQQYGPVGKVITDGHGGYYIGEFSSSSPGNYTYTLKHVWVDGHTSVLHSRSIPKLVSGDNPKVWGDASYNIDFSVTENDDGSQTVTLDVFRKYYNSDLELKPSFEKEVFNEKFFSKADQPIEEEKGEEVILPLNPDGSVTLPDGTVLLPNEDGTITIGGTDYVPKPGVLSPTDLLKQLLDLQEQLKELEEQLQFEKDKEQDKALDDAIDEAVDEAVESYDGNLSEFLLNSRITQVFPFCLPFDFVRGVKLFSATPVAPKFDVNFDIPAFGSYPGTHNVITLDFSAYSKYFVVVRWITTIIFIIGLTLATSKLIKW